MKIKNRIALLLLLTPGFLFAQKTKENLGDKQYEVVKPYKPVLGESMKITDVPEGDTTSATPPAQDYTIRAKKADAEYETSVIKAVNIKDEQVPKLYRSYLKLGIGNYSTYYGDLYVNALRSKKGSIGLALNHHSGNPGFDDAGPAGFSNNHGGLNGKYFLEKSTFSGDVDYNREVVHYYGYNDDYDTIIDRSDIDQHLNNFGFKFNLGSNYLTRDHFDYDFGFGYKTLTDAYEVKENDFLLTAKGGKKVKEYYVSLDAMFNYFHKSLSNYDMISINNDMKRSIVSFAPAVTFNQAKMDLVLGLNVSIEKNLNSKIRVFPNINIKLPIAEKILYVFAGVNGNVIKNSYQTITTENPFVTSNIQPQNTVNKLELKGGLNGNFSQRISFMAMVKYSKMDRMMFYVNDTLYFNMFNAVYDDGGLLNIHAEVTYKTSERFSASLKFDQFNYKLDKEMQPWHRPGTEVKLSGSYNLWDKFIVNATIFGRGKYYARQVDSTAVTAVKVNGYADINLGIDYRYTKILSIFVNFNNVGFSKYYRWYQYPSERFNVLGGITLSF